MKLPEAGLSCKHCRSHEINCSSCIKAELLICGLEALPWWWNQQFFSKATFFNDKHWELGVLKTKLILHMGIGTFISLLGKLILQYTNSLIFLYYDSFDENILIFLAIQKVRLYWILCRQEGVKNPMKLTENLCLAEVLVLSLSAAGNEGQ